MDENLIKRRWMVREEELDEDQYKVRTLRPDNYVIDGCAGSGKTILALHKAKEIQDNNEGTYLLVMFTKTLEAFIKDGISSLELSPDCVCTVDQLDNKGYGQADYIIVDEVQDLTLKQLEKLISMANKYILFFGDNAQKLYKKGTLLEDVKNFAAIPSSNFKTLKYNHRLPIQIAQFAQYVSSIPTDIVSRCVKQDGTKPVILEFSTELNEMSYIANMIRNEGWLDVGILVNTNERVQQLVNYFSSIGLTVEYKYDKKVNGRDRTYQNLDFFTPKPKPKIMTYHSSKGLQFDHVILPMCDVNGGQKYRMQEALYVALTRASVDLTVTYTASSLSPYIKRIPSNKNLYTYHKM
ncbi:AAA family ATPase [Paenibacillus tritici]|uniref:AAA family ATPase n=2 Tax=Paenibacillus tritici TaxID=1873425 RepID=A0ABX2DK42_9BACL|nr:AAA family ATPase [Paenibacillus tritici]